MQTTFFEILAECSIALAGFGAVHAVLQGSDGPRGIFRAWVVVSQGAFAFVLSILALLLVLASLPPDVMWRGASTVGAIGAGALVGATIVFDNRMTHIGQLPQARLNLRTAQLSSILATLAMLINVIGWPWRPGPFLYATATTFVLTTGLLALLHSFYVPLKSALYGEGSAPAGGPSAT